MTGSTRAEQRRTARDQQRLAAKQGEMLLAGYTEALDELGALAANLEENVVRSFRGSGLTQIGPVRGEILEGDAALTRVTACGLHEHLTADQWLHYATIRGHLSERGGYLVVAHAAGR